MEQKFDTGLNSKINEFKDKFSIVSKIEESFLFEIFSNYVVISNILNEDFNAPESIKAGPSTRGIDAIAIIVNGRVIKDEADLDTIGEREKIKLKICFIQSTIQNSFKLQKLQSFTDAVLDFMQNTHSIEPFSDIVSKIFSEKDRYINLMSETPEIELFFCSGKTDHKLDGNEIENEKNKIKNRSDHQYKFVLNNIHFLQYQELKAQYDNIDKFLEVEIDCISNILLSEKEKIPISFIAILNFKELKKIITTNDNSLREKAFVENARSKIVDSKVNNDIQETLKNEKKRDYFSYLNNGITILCEDIERHKTKQAIFIIKRPRIINGCQTSHMLYECSEENSSEIDNVEIIAKIISTSDVELKKDIIYATNNQNAISKDLEALNSFHNKLEEYFRGRDEFQIHFERLRGQYSNITPPYKILTKEAIAKAYISIFLKKPHEMKSSALSKIEDYISATSIFNNTSDEELEKYYYTGILYYLLHYLIANGEITLKSQTMDMHILMACDILLAKKNIDSIDKKIKYLEDSNNASNIFQETANILNGKEYLFERRGFYASPKTERLIKEINAPNPTSN